MRSRRGQSSDEHDGAIDLSDEALPSYYGLGSLAIPTLEQLELAGDVETFTAGMSELRAIVQRKQPSEQDVKYWGGADEPWRNGTDDRAITDSAVIAREEKRKRDAEEEDRAAAASPEARADRLHKFGIQISFLLYLTWELDLWTWQTWEVVQFLVKPATERQARCRFAELPCVVPFTGPAGVFASHCWGGKWGDLVAAVCSGADTRRVVWIDIFAVRQWPGNGADLDFRGVIGRSQAALVAVAPVAGKLSEAPFEGYDEGTDYVASDEYEITAKVLAFCRLWCLVEIFAALSFSKGLIFRGAAVASVGRSKRQVVLVGGGRDSDAEKKKLMNMLANCGHIVDLEKAKCAVPADREREIAAIKQATAKKGGIAHVNKVVKAALISGGVAVQGNVAAVDNFICGETEALKMLPAEKVEAAIEAACAAGQVEVLKDLLSDRECEGSGVGGASQIRAAAARRVIAENFYPLFIAAKLGRADTVELLLHMEGVDVSRIHPSTGAASLFSACEVGHEAVVRLLLDHDATDVNQANTEDGYTPLLIACQEGHVEAVRLLLAHEAIDANRAATNDGCTPLYAACDRGHVEVVRLLLADSAKSINQALLGDGCTPLFIACQGGHEEVVRLLLEIAATDVNQATTDGCNFNPLFIACQEGHEGVVRLLLAREEIEVNHTTTEEHGANPLYVACHNNHEEVVRLLLAHATTDVNQAATETGATPLFIACFCGHETVVRMVLAHDATDVNQATTEDDYTPLFVACSNGHGTVVEILLAHASTNMDAATTIDGSTPLHAACENDHEDVVRLLLAHGEFDVNQTTDGGATPLFKAFLNGHKAVVQLLLAHVVRICAIDQRRHRPSISATNPPDTPPSAKQPVHTKSALGFSEHTQKVPGPAESLRHQKQQTPQTQKIP